LFSVLVGFLLLGYDGHAHAMSPQVYIIAGPNGVGKTTFAMKFLPD